MSLPGRIEVDIDCNTGNTNCYRCSNNTKKRNKKLNKKPKHIPNNKLHATVATKAIVQHKQTNSQKQGISPVLAAPAPTKRRKGRKQALVTTA